MDIRTDNQTIVLSFKKDSIGNRSNVRIKRIDFNGDGLYIENIDKDLCVQDISCYVDWQPTFDELDTIINMVENLNLSEEFIEEFTEKRKLIADAYLNSEYGVFDYFKDYYEHLRRVYMFGESEVGIVLQRNLPAFVFPRFDDRFVMLKYDRMGRTPGFYPLVNVFFSYSTVEVSEEFLDIPLDNNTFVNIFTWLFALLSLISEKHESKIYEKLQLLSNSNSVPTLL